MLDVFVRLKKQTNFYNKKYVFLSWGEKKLHRRCFQFSATESVLEIKCHILISSVSTYTFCYSVSLLQNRSINLYYILSAKH